MGLERGDRPGLGTGGAGSYCGGAGQHLDAEITPKQGGRN